MARCGRSSRYLQYQRNEEKAMFLHLGSDRTVAVDDIISINDYEIVSSDINREFMERMNTLGRVVNILEKQPKSFVLTKDKVYLSAISSLTLKRRAGMIFDIDEN